MAGPVDLDLKEGPAASVKFKAFQEVLVLLGIEIREMHVRQASPIPNLNLISIPYVSHLAFGGATTLPQ